MTYLPLPQIKEVSHRFERIFGYGREAIQGLKLAHRSGSLTTPVFFSKLLDDNDKENGLTDRELEEEAAEFMITGTDTTSNSLTYLVWSVLRHPAVKARLEGEVASLADGYKDSDVEKLRYLNCVVQESLRLYGAASGSHPRSVPRGGWNVEGIFLPEDTVVTTQAYSLHRLSHVFEDPYRFVLLLLFKTMPPTIVILTRSSFKPERWLDPSAEMQLAYIPFGGGPRSKLPRWLVDEKEHKMN